MVWRKTGRNDEILTTREDGNHPSGGKFRNKRKKNPDRITGKQKQFLQLVCQVQEIRI